MITQITSGHPKAIAVVQDLPGHVGQKVAQLGTQIALENAA